MTDHALIPPDLATRIETLTCQGLALHDQAESWARDIDEVTGLFEDAVRHLNLDDDAFELAEKTTGLGMLSSIRDGFTEIAG